MLVRFPPSFFFPFSLQVLLKHGVIIFRTILWWYQRLSTVMTFFKFDLLISQATSSTSAPRITTTSSKLTHFAYPNFYLFFAILFPLNRSCLLHHLQGCIIIFVISFFLVRQQPGFVGMASFLSQLSTTTELSLVTATAKERLHSRANLSEDSATANPTSLVGIARDAGPDIIAFLTAFVS